jgi:hypothetical protein
MRVPFVLTVVLLLVAANGLLANARPAVAKEPVAEVSAQRGTVTALRQGSAVLLVRGAPVFRADKIYTYKDAGVKLRFVDGTVVAAGADSRLIVAEYMGEESTAGRVIELLQGILRATISRVRRGGFDVRTRTAVASARSTDWMVEAKSDTSAVFVIQGEVAVTSLDAPGQVVLGQGDGTDVAVGKPPKDPVQWGQKRVDDFLARTAVE